ncbi:MAG: aminoacyl-tRNA hydrolase [Deltaproteobacteria bacterium]|jgi:PTH1 family peptidyl-tRNA hydrolase|nr:aminoacyl-tRNA hydrolase [Deltaproteobacteria bacterium]
MPGFFSSKKARPPKEGSHPRLVLGLGNPGPGYADTRHNAGYMALELFAERNRLENPVNFKSSVIISGNIEGARVILAWPLTYMNLSGVAARELYAFYKVQGTENILVLHDEMDLPPGRVKVSFGGGTAGHNGLCSLKENLPGDFAHVRIGIGRPPKDDWESFGVSRDYVLSPFEDDELAPMQEGLGLAADATLAWIRGGLAASQRIANKRPKKPKKEKPEGESPDGDPAKAGSDAGKGVSGNNVGEGRDGGHGEGHEGGHEGGHGEGLDEGHDEGND